MSAADGTDDLVGFCEAPTQACKVTIGPECDQTLDPFGAVLEGRRVDGGAHDYGETGMVWLSLDVSDHRSAQHEETSRQCPE